MEKEERKRAEELDFDFMKNHGFPYRRIYMLRPIISLARLVGRSCRLTVAVCSGRIAYILRCYFQMRRNGRAVGCARGCLSPLVCSGASDLNGAEKG